MFALFNWLVLKPFPSDIAFAFSLGTVSRDAINFYVENLRLTATLIISVFFVTHVSIFNLNINYILTYFNLSINNNIY